MIRFTTFVMILAVAALAAGCGSGEKQADSAAETAERAVEAAHDAAAAIEAQGEQAAAAAQEAAEAVPAGAMTVEIGCGGCTYHLEGVTTCTPAVKVGDKAMLLTGMEVDAHALGLCTAPKQAVVEGKVEDGKFVASKVDIQ